MTAMAKVMRRTFQTDPAMVFTDVGPRFARLRTVVRHRTITAQINHLVRRNPQVPGRLGGTPGDTLCGLTRFDRDGRKADIAGWSVEGGLSGPDIEQIECSLCRSRWRVLRHLNRGDKPWQAHPPMPAPLSLPRRA